MTHKVRSNTLLPSLSNLSPMMNVLENTLLGMLDDVYNGPEFSAGFNYPKFNAFKYMPDGSVHYELVIDIAVPFVEENDLTIDARDGDNVVVISAKAHQEEGVPDSYYFVRQVPRSAFRQEFTINKDYSVKEMDAKLENGVLRLTFPSNQTAEPKPRRIKIG